MLPHAALIASSIRIDRFARRHVRSLQRVRRPLLPNFFHAQRVCKCVHLTFFCPCMCQELFPEEVAPEEVLSRCFCFNCSNSQSAPGSILFQRRGGKFRCRPLFCCTVRFSTQSHAFPRVFCLRLPMVPRPRVWVAGMPLLRYCRVLHYSPPFV